MSEGAAEMERHLNRRPEDSGGSGMVEGAEELAQRFKVIPVFLSSGAEADELMHFQPLTADFSFKCCRFRNSGEGRAPFVSRFY